jgi:hypothetical protein
MEGYRNEAKILQQRLKHVYRLIRHRERQSQRDDRHTVASGDPRHSSGWEVRDFDEEEEEEEEENEDHNEHFLDEEEDPEEEEEEREENRERDEEMLLTERLRTHRDPEQRVQQR